jgi:3-oxoacyl-[acyl-carrier-protein] synthase I
VTVTRRVELAIVGSGAVTGVGFTLPATVAAIQAAIDGFSESTFVDRWGEPITACCIPATEADAQSGFVTGGEPRLAALLAMAVEEAVIDLPMTWRIALCVVLPDPSRYGDTAGLAQCCSDACRARIGDALVGADVVFPRGSAGVALAIVHADTLLRTPGARVDAVVIAGVDSWMDAAVIEHGLQWERLITSHNADGCVPGEGAAAVVLCRPTSSPAARYLQLRGVGVEEEAAGRLDEVPCTGRGLAGAMRAALQAGTAAASAVQLRLSDVAGEQYFFEESAAAWGRVLRDALPPTYAQLLPATRTGELGAAMGPLLLGIAAQLPPAGTEGGALTLLHWSGTDALRGAVVAEWRSS